MKYLQLQNSIHFIPVSTLLADKWLMFYWKSQDALCLFWHSASVGGIRFTIIEMMMRLCQTWYPTQIGRNSIVTLSVFSEINLTDLFRGPWT